MFGSEHPSGCCHRRRGHWFHDSDPIEPVLTRPDFNSAGGRGVWLVDTIASRWGHPPEPPGKVVWFEMDLPATPGPAATRG